MACVRLVAGATVALLCALLGPTSAFAQGSAEEEVARQTARLISEAIGSRVEEDVEDIYPAPAAEEAGAAPADMPNTVWGSLTYNRIDFDDVDGGVDVFLVTTGFDHRFGSLIPGVSLTGTFANLDAVTGSSETATISPYLAYIVNDFLFVSGLVGLSLGSSDFAGLDAESLGVFTQEEANLVFGEGNWRFNAKAGHRFTYNESDTDAGPATDSTAHTIIGGGKVGYAFDMVTPYVGTQFEHIIPEVGKDDDFLYFYLGFKVDVEEEFSMDLSGQAEVINETTDSYKVTWQGRFRF